MSGGIWLTGDPHLGHPLVAALRGFVTERSIFIAYARGEIRDMDFMRAHADTEAHDEAFIAQWRKQVRPEDTVHVLGDLSSGSRTGEARALDIIETLPGRKRLILGNHDSASSIHRALSPHIRRFGEVFERVGDFGRIQIDGRMVLLSHYPYNGDHTEEDRLTQFRLPDLGAPLVHAHTHSYQRWDGRQMCVSWEAWKRLVGMSDVVSWLGSLPAECVVRS